MKIIRLAVSNILRIEAANVAPDPEKGLVIVAGKNGAGKSSLLNSIALALSGRDLPEQPIRKNSPKGAVTLETEEFIIERSFSQTGGAKLVVRPKPDGKPMPAAQTFLDSLYSRVSFDPLTFVRLEPSKQVETLKRLVGMDFSDLDAKDKTARDERLLLGRDVAAARARLGQCVKHEDAPEEEVVIADAVSELQKAQTHNQENAAITADLSEYDHDVQNARDKVAMFRNKAEAIRINLAHAENELSKWEEDVKTCEKNREAHKARIEALESIDTAPLVLKVSNAETINRRVRENQAYAKAESAFKAAESAHEEVEAELSDLAHERERRLKTAAFPVEGMGFSESGVTLNQLPFQQASASEQIKTSLAIGRALNPKLPVMLIRDGSLLDADSLKIVEEFAEKTGSQVWLEQVSNGDNEGATVVIEDGNVVKK